MDVKPLLTFNKPRKNKKRDDLNGSGGKIQTPGISYQANKLFPKLDSLSHEFSQYIELSNTPESMQPEKVLVIELAGDVQSFARALSKVAGFELLAHNLVAERFEDEHFYDLNKKKQKKPVKKNAYLTMSNLAGLKKLRSMWGKYVETKQIEYGYSGLRDAFLQCIDIRFWDTKDRLESTRILDDWRERVEYAQHDMDELVSFEIELWFRSTEAFRLQAESHIKHALEKAGGFVSNTFVHQGARYHALLGKIHISQVQEVIDSGGAALELMRCDEVMYFRPLGQSMTPSRNTDEDLSKVQKPNLANYTSDLNKTYKVALLDGLPLSNHEALKGRISIDDPDDFESRYTAPKEQVHGTSMASLIIHGDLNAPDEYPLSRLLYVRPILVAGEADFKGNSSERVPEDFLPIELIHRAVVRMKKGEAGMPPSAPEVRVVNLSIGDPYRLFDSQMSPWARMIDWLSYEYDLLFVVSAGNMPHCLELEGVSEAELRNLSPQELEVKAVQAINKQRQERRMMSPAEAINALTVRSSHSDDYSGHLPPNIIDVFQTENMFSPINPITLGKNRSIKPEILMPGGRQVYINQTYLLSADVKLQPRSGNQFGPGVKTALPTSIPGRINEYGYSAGTSNAAALATRRLALLLETIDEMREFGGTEALSGASDAVILKALLTHGAGLPAESKDVVTRALKTRKNSHLFKGELNQYFGFGLVNERRIHGCINSQATLLYTGKIKSETSHDYFLPLPTSLSAKTINRRLIVTVAWLSPVNHGHQDYREAQLWASSSHSQLNAKDNANHHHLMKNGTVFHEVRSGKKAASFVQGDNLVVKVNCHARAGAKDLEVEYALVVTLDTTDTNLRIYDEVKQGLVMQVQQSV